MTLLNGLLALGALAFTIPLAIHLLSRSRFRTVDWGAMHLLDSVVRINRRRIELLNLLLLLLRCLLPVLLAFCLARPVLTGFRSLPGDQPRTIVIAVDESRSMAARDADGQPRIERVKRELTTMLESLSRQDEVILLGTNSIDRVAGSMGATDAIRAIKEIKAEGGPVELGRIVQSAAEASENATHMQRQIIVASDFQSHIVGDGAIETLERLKTSLDEASIRPSISFLNVGVESDKVANVSVDAIESDSPAVVAGRSAKFSARIRNAGDSPLRDLRVAWSVAGKPLPPRTVTIPPRASVTARLTHKITDVGVNPITLSVEHSDALPDDNSRTIGVDVIREINVLLVDGDPSNRPLAGETDFLAIALSPFAFGGQDQPDAVRTSKTIESKLVAEIDEQSPDIVVLANVAKPDDAARERLARFVNEGGSLIVFDGDKIKPDAYNDIWKKDDATWRLPAKMGEVVGGPVSTDREAELFPIGDLNRQYAAWNIISGGSGATTSNRPLADVDVGGYRKLEIDAADVATGAARITLLSFVSGDPVVIASRQGGGQIVQFAIPCDGDWSNWPMRLVFLPMMQQMVLDLAGSRKQTTLDVGAPISVPTAELTALIPSDAKTDSSKPPTYATEDPSGTIAATQPVGEAATSLMLGDAALVGTYRVRQTTPVMGGEPITTQTIRVAEVPAIESQLRDVDASRLSHAAEIIGAQVYGEVSSLTSDDQTRRFGREVWRWLLVALLIGMVGELFLQQRGLRGKRSLGGASSKTPPSTWPTGDAT